MKLVYKIILLNVIIVGVLLWKSNIFHTSFAYPYKLDESVLFFDANNENMANKIKIYLDDIDDLLVVNSKFELSDTLVYNYDFLVYFALDYVLLNYEYYYDRIKYFDNYTYYNKELSEKSTNQYIALEEIYLITDKFFGVRDFEIVNDNVNVIDGYISLIDYTLEKFSLMIDEVDVEYKEDTVKAIVDYGDNVSYLYTFFNQDNVLKLKNIEVLS